MLKFQEDFFRDLQFNRQYSENTIAAYKRDLSIYEDFNKTKKKITEIYPFLTQKKLSPKSQVRIISCIRSYFKYLQSRGEPTPDMKFLSFPKLKQKLPKIIDVKEFESLLEFSKDKNPIFTIRNHLVLSFLYGLGCRVSELIHLDIKDFNPTESWIHITGKGNKQRILPLSQNLYQLLTHYLKESRPFIGKANQNTLIFNNKGNRPSRVDIWRWLKKWSQLAGFKDVKNPHSFRHGCATDLLEQGADLRSIQKLLGHLNIQTTQIYTSVTSKYLKDQVDQFHPLSQSESSIED